MVGSGRGPGETVRFAAYAMDIDAALAICSDDEGDNDTDAGSAGVGRHHPALQRARAQAGWVKRIRREQCSAPAVLHIEHINHQAVRKTDRLDFPGCKRKRGHDGQGSQAMFSLRVFLRAGFAKAEETFTSIAKRFQQSGSDKSASSKYIADTKACVASILQDEVKSAFRRLFFPTSVDERASYCIESIQFDEASFSLQGLGKKVQTNPILCTRAALLHKLGEDDPTFFNYPSSLCLMRNKSPT